ncbi:hypothetical protein ASPZODRAFT_91201 [Penicilliopsis zonata CBS 506.65]|uniref:Uncharacterized protein n=1 Tax=Penicilliopsis zonata CBS 506.65 TaxID=1073090 RepID=A0A1L9SP64_9EURO|nr:hypothetical protein ASPZODRAFT_91201 [Penicilliopsis zonata CBS 506.65]OJJ49025.1 hypothetical protein ASPZODRAFT_91201 [Penicilliopsis zonata CBS 506.65]
MPLVSELHIAIQKGSEPHEAWSWSLFINGPSMPKRTILHLSSCFTHFYLEHHHVSNYRSENLVEVLPLCEVDTLQINAIVDIARPIHNQCPRYNCQHYILELLSALEEARIVNGGDRRYRENRKAVEEMQGRTERISRV